ncbi:family 16 glycosylhydrolase [Leptothoe sp. ISB3NOV94-8A]|nr:family 16 glycosylhydrolase [Adonisia turfae]
MSKKFTKNKNFEVTFENTFDSVDDLSDWNTTYYYGSRTNTFNNEEQYYLDDAFQFNEDGTLSIVATRLDTPIEAFEGVDQWLLENQGKDTSFDWTSGMLSGHDKAAFQYGYIEISAQIPAGQGMWPAFWMLPTDGGWPPEIDIMEALGHDTSTIHQTVHYETESGRSMHHDQTSGTDFSEGFHTYGVEWKENKLTFYIDGQKTYTLHEDIPQETMYLLSNLAVGGWAGSPDDTTADENEYVIDYIRVYQDKKGLLEGGSGNDVLDRANGHISGLGGDDVLSLSGKGELYGGEGNDLLTGGTQSNYLVGGRHSDVIDGGRGRDVLIGVEFGDSLAGQGEVDVLIGGQGADVFKLGDATQVYYSDGDASTYGLDDYALIKDFELKGGDSIELHGRAEDYFLGAVEQGTAIFSEMENTPELIAILEGVESSAISTNSFQFV